MTGKYILDACALIAFLYGEDGGNKVKFDIIENNENIKFEWIR